MASGHVCIIGGGAAGCVMALRLARRGVRVTVLESGPRYTPEQKEHLFLETLAGRIHSNPFHLVDPRIERFRNNGERELPLDVERVRGIGGTTLYWLGSTPRMIQPDFRMRSTFGVGEDWPIGYDDLEPYYGQAEREIGVSGTEDNRFAEHRSTPYPMPPIPYSYADRYLLPFAEQLGIEFHHTPQARNSRPYGGRSQCLSCAVCPQCPSGAKATFDRTHAEPAEATGLARFITDATCLRLETDATGGVRRAIYAGMDKAERAQEADVFVVTCGGIETPRLLLLSGAPAHPHGLGNRSGRVGQYLMNHPVVQTSGRVEAELYPYRVGFESTESFQFYATKTRDELGAFIINMNNSGGCGPTPVEVAEWGSSWGDELATQIRNEFGHTLSLSAGVDQMPDEKNTVTLDPENRDYFGQPIPLITYRFDDYTQRALDRAAAIQRQLLQAAGAKETAAPKQWWPGHHMGTVRMGKDPDTSVVDAWCRVHDVPNLFAVSTGCFVTGGVANPTLTLSALALRTADYIADGLRTPTAPR